MGRKEAPEHERLIDEALAEVRSRLIDVADGTVAPSLGEEDIGQAMRTAMGAAVTRHRQKLSERNEAETAATEPVALKEVASRRVAEWRAHAGVTQAGLAEAMRRIGFAWERITVAEVESGKRRLGLEEAVGLGVLFGTPAVAFLSPSISERVQVNDDLVLPYTRYMDLWMGESGDPEGWGSHEFSWNPEGVPAEVAGLDLEEAGGEADWRPVGAMAREWAARKAMGDSIGYSGVPGSPDE